MMVRLPGDGFGGVRCQRSLLCVFAGRLASIDRRRDGELLFRLLLVSKDEDGLIFQSVKYTSLSKSCSLLNAAIMLSPP